MVELKIVVSDPKSGRAFNVDASGGVASAIVGKRIGEEIDAGAMGLAGYKIHDHRRIRSDRNTRKEELARRRTQKTSHDKRCRVSPDNGRRAQEKNNPVKRDHR